MTTRPPSADSASADTLPLADRVAERVLNARLALENRSNTKRTSNQQADRETQSLKRVFRDMGDAYRRYRSQTGRPVVPELREAAYRFRAEPSLASLVVVAGYLDELDLLS